MKRPRKKDYSEGIKIINGVVTTYPSDRYEKDLETYCNELEKKCDRLEKALDKACSILEDEVVISQAIGEEVYTKPYRTKEQWKEYFLKDE